MTVPATAAEPRRQRDPERTRQEILDVALAEFARNGYSGARVDEIAAKTRTTKRMIYYYFTNKEQLYIAVLERAYATVRDAERQLDVDHLEPVLAMRTLAELTFDHHESHQDFIRLVAIENIHRAEHIAKSAALAQLNTPAASVIASILERGRATGAFRRRAEPIDVHMIISAFCVFRVANQHTFGAIFGVDLLDSATRGHYRQMVGDLVVSYLSTTLCPIADASPGWRSAGRRPWRPGGSARS
jgi:AcrR family transcriptional regulator